MTVGTPVERYRALARELTERREAADGNLPADVEARYADKLDEIWWEMSEVEQGEIEREFATGVVL